MNYSWLRNGGIQFYTRAFQACLCIGTGMVKRTFHSGTEEMNLLTYLRDSAGLSCSRFLSLVKFPLASLGPLSKVTVPSSYPLSLSEKQAERARVYQHQVLPNGPGRRRPEPSPSGHPNTVLHRVSRPEPGWHCQDYQPGSGHRAVTCQLPGPCQKI